uniref:Uncharacterized protein n=1 Tax=Pyricularia oryzae (strain P131) TaxID=1143193 RepID=L7J8S5_PYRO1
MWLVRYMERSVHLAQQGGLV